MSNLEVVEGLLIKCPICQASSPIVRNKWPERNGLAGWYDSHLRNFHRPAPIQERCAFTPEDES